MRLAAREAVGSLLNAHPIGRGDRSARLWDVVMLQSWFDAWRKTIIDSAATRSI